jgi:hypothetical protein
MKMKKTQDEKKTAQATSRSMPGASRKGGER